MYNENMKIFDKNSSILNNKNIIGMDVDESFNEYEENESNLMLLLMPAIIISGIIGNILNLLIFSRSAMRKSSTFRFLLYLSGFDTLVLLVGALDAYLNFGFQIEVRKYSLFTCRFHTFGTYLLAQSSSTILMLISIDRALVMSHKRISFIFRKKKNQSEMKKLKNELSLSKTENNSPKSLSKFSKLRRIDAIILATFFILILFNSHFLLFLGLNLHEINDNNQNIFEIKNSTNFTQSNNSPNFSIEYELNCYPKTGDHYRYFLDNIYVWFDIFVYSFVPFLIMSVCSGIIIFRIRKSTKKYFNSLLNKRSVNKSNFYRKLKRNHRLKRNRQLLYMLLITNVYFFLSSLPYCITFLMYRGSIDNNQLQFSVHTLSYTNNAINFIFYGISSQKYREELKKLFCRQTKQKQVIKLFSNNQNSHRINTIRTNNDIFLLKCDSCKEDELDSSQITMKLISKSNKMQTVHFI